MSSTLSRRELLRRLALAGMALGIRGPLAAQGTEDPDRERLAAWTRRLRDEGLARVELPLGRSADRVGELAAGTPYAPGRLDQYLLHGGDPLATEPLTLSLTSFDCVTLVESCLAVSRVAGHAGPPTWAGFGREVERMRYRGGTRRGYASRLHYFSEWIADGARRGLVRDLGQELGGTNDARPLRFMTTHRQSYPALANPAVLREIHAMEQQLDNHPRWMVPRAAIPDAAARIESGDVLAFATSIPGLDVTHAALAYRDKAGVLRVLHAPLSGGVVEVAARPLAEYVAAIHRSTGVLVARPLWD